MLALFKLQPPNNGKLQIPNSGKLQLPNNGKLQPPNNGRLHTNILIWMCTVLETLYDVIQYLKKRGGGRREEGEGKGEGEKGEGSRE